eukprot:scaffold28524_cov30-Phaeocystis_antarctica.AAC.1
MGRAALSGTAGRSWSVPGKGLAHSYEVDPDRQAAPRWPACCPKAHKQQFEEPALQAKGSPETQCARLPQGCPRLRLRIVVRERAGAGDGARAS